MLKIRITGEVVNCYEKIDINLNGLVFVLQNHLNLDVIDVDDFFAKYNLKGDIFKQYLKILKELNIINYQVSNNIIDITFDKTVIDCNKPNLVNFFGITSSQEKQICVNSSEETHKNMTLALLNKIDLPSTNLSMVITTKDDMIKYIRLVYPHEIIKDHELYVGIKDLEFIYDAAFKYNVNREVINLLIDYTIKKTTHNNFVREYAIKILFDWKKQQLATIESVLEYLKSSSEKVLTSRGSYSEPEFLSTGIDANENVEIDLKGLIDGSYN